MRFGSPLRATDQDVFKGRRRVAAAIEDHFVNSDRSPALLLYGDRRIGKSSVLLNLPRLLSSEFVPVYIDSPSNACGDGSCGISSMRTRAATVSVRPRGRQGSHRDAVHGQAGSGGGDRWLSAGQERAELMTA